WQATHRRTPGKAIRRASGIGSSHSSQWLAPGPVGKRLRARLIASSTVASIWSCTALSPAHPVAMEGILASRALTVPNPSGRPSAAAAAAADGGELAQSLGGYGAIGLPQQRQQVAGRQPGRDPQHVLGLVH